MKQSQSKYAALLTIIRLLREPAPALVSGGVLEVVAELEADVSEGVPGPGLPPVVRGVAAGVGRAVGGEGLGGGGDLRVVGGLLVVVVGLVAALIAGGVAGLASWIGTGRSECYCMNNYFLFTSTLLADVVY